MTAERIPTEYFTFFRVSSCLNVDPGSGYYRTITSFITLKISRDKSDASVSLHTVHRPMAWSYLQERRLEAEYFPCRCVLESVCGVQLCACKLLMHSAE